MRSNMSAVATSICKEECCSFFLKAHSQCMSQDWSIKGPSWMPPPTQEVFASCLAKPFDLKFSTDLHCTNCSVQHCCDGYARISHQITDNHCPLTLKIPWPKVSFPGNSYLGSFSNLSKWVWGMIISTLPFNTYADKIYTRTHLLLYSRKLCIYLPYFQKQFPKQQAVVKSQKCHSL